MTPDLPPHTDPRIGVIIRNGRTRFYVWIGTLYVEGSLLEVEAALAAVSAGR